jgi:hypothetical protein
MHAHTCSAAEDEHRFLSKRPSAAFFCHDTVMDYFMYMAFADSDTLQAEYMDDPCFRGVYLLFAERATLQRAQLLRASAPGGSAYFRCWTRMQWIGGLPDRFVSSPLACAQTSGSR